MNLSPRVKIALIIAGCVVLVGSVAFALIYPQITKSASLEVKQKSAESELREARATLAARTTLAANSEKTKAALAEQKAKVPQGAEIANVLRTIQDMSFENNHWLFEITNDVPETTEKTFYNTWESKIVIEGSWLDTVSFLRKLRDMDRQVRVTAVDFTRLTNIRGGVNPPPNRVIKHWDPEEYPVRTSITCDFYFIPEKSVKDSMKPLVVNPTSEEGSDNAAATPAKAPQGGAAK